MKLIYQEDLKLSSIEPCARALEAYQAITNDQTVLSQQGWSNENVFLSRYYWFKLHVRMREQLSGFDAGLEQQAFQILENPSPDCAPDWHQIEQVELAVSQKLASSQ